jgi:drug/metabolite transporter (DMT)-like permease
MSFNGWLLILINGITAASSNILLKFIITRVGGISFSVDNMSKLVLSPPFFLGILLYFVSSFLWFYIIAIEPISIAYPVLVSVVFFLITIGAAIFLGEVLSMLRLIGLILIIGGLFIVSLRS